MANSQPQGSQGARSPQEGGTSTIMKVIEVLAESPDSWEAAAQQAQHPLGIYQGANGTGGERQDS